MQGRSFSPHRSLARWWLRAKLSTRQQRLSLLSFAHSIRYELRDTGVTVTALQPGPTDTDFFHRAGMDNTKVGSEGKTQSEPDDVAKAGSRRAVRWQRPRLLSFGDDQDRRMQWRTYPGTVKGSMHEKMAKPIERKMKVSPIEATKEKSHGSMALQRKAECGGSSTIRRQPVRSWTDTMLPPPADKDGKQWVRTTCSRASIDRGTVRALARHRESATVAGTNCRSPRDRRRRPRTGSW